MLKVIARITCDQCGDFVEVAQAIDRTKGIIQEARDEAHKWLRLGDQDYCPSCKVSAQLASTTGRH